MHAPRNGPVAWMLSFDIETEGLNKHRDRITVAAVYDPDAGIERCYNFIKGTSEENHSEVCGFLGQLDRAETLCSFNGARFDLPFIIQQFGVPPARYSMWFVKLFDYFEVSKLVFSSSCSLNRLLEANGFRVKTSHGMQAVEWAREKRWQELEDYCMQDTILTHQISSCDDVLIPLTGKRHVWHRRGRDGSHGFDYGDEEFEPLLPP